MSDIFAIEKASNVRPFSVSESASRRISKLLEDEPSGTMLRVTVSGGGCSGYQYGFGFDTRTTADDHQFEAHGVTVVVDDVSLDLLAGAELDFVEDLIGASFQVKNPNATSSCGCGASFSV
jgi:iron-sulfur cluster insertion protein